MINIESLTSPPLIGQIYLVPCIFGAYVYLNGKNKSRWWPVLRPSHQDSKYILQVRTIWKETDLGFEEIEEEFYENDCNFPHHYHVDPRFTLSEWYTEDEQKLESWHNTITIDSSLEWREMECIRDMPIQVLYKTLGDKFVDDYKNTKMKCFKCPHKGMLLGSMPIIDGVITCPGHGLKFKNGDCITK